MKKEEFASMFEDSGWIVRTHPRRLVFTRDDGACTVIWEISDTELAHAATSGRREAGGSGIRFKGFLAFHIEECLAGFEAPLGYLTMSPKGHITIEER